MEKIAIVTGANSELAQETFNILKRNDIKVVVLYHNKSLITNCDYLLKCDLTNEDEVKETFLKIAKKYPKINYLINIASLSLDDDILNKSGKDFLRVVNVNVVGSFLAIKYAIPMLENGVIINISSTDGIDTGHIYNIDYSASKSALNTMTSLLSKRFDNCKIVALAPNYIDTFSTRSMNQNFLIDEMARINQKRLLSVKEVAQKIYDLLLDKDLPSGSIIRMDGKK